METRVEVYILGEAKVRWVTAGAITAADLAAYEDECPDPKGPAAEQDAESLKQLTIFPCITHENLAKLHTTRKIAFRMFKVRSRRGCGWQLEGWPDRSEVVMGTTLRILIVLCLLPYAGLAQRNQLTGPVPGPNLKVRDAAQAADHRITLDVVVSDKSGQPVSGLQQQDFTILDNKLPRDIMSFSANQEASQSADQVAEIIFVVDAVNIPFQQAELERDDLKRFVLQQTDPLPVPMAIAFFTDTSKPTLPTATRDRSALVESLAANPPGLRAMERSQGFYGQVQRTQVSLHTLEGFTHDAEQVPGRKLVIWLSRGWPMLSGPGIQYDDKSMEQMFHSVVALSDGLREARITLYSVDPVAGGFQAFYYQSFLKGVGSVHKMDAAYLGLQVLAVQSGGQVLNSSTDIARLIANCLTDTKAYYSLSFEAPPGNHTDELHSLVVKVDRPKLTVRTRTVYYAQPYQEAHQ